MGRGRRADTLTTVRRADKRRRTGGHPLAAEGRAASHRRATGGGRACGGGRAQQGTGGGLWRRKSPPSKSVPRRTMQAPGFIL